VECFDTSFEAFTAAMFQVEVVRVVTPFSVVVGYQRFGVPCFIHFQGEVWSALLLKEVFI